MDCSYPFSSVGDFMFQAFFLWFYCLSITDAVLLVIAASTGYLLLRQWLGVKSFWRPMIALLFMTWLAVIAVATLTDRTPGIIPAEPELMPFHSYRAVMAGGNKEILRSNFMNVVLFYPAGLFACELLLKSWSWAKRVILVAVLFALVSVGIEFCQYHFALGQAEVDDVLHNALGALIGSLISTIPIRWKPGKRKK